VSPFQCAWSQKYKDHGLVVVGVYAPEFSFEHNVDNIRWALKDMKIEYPVAVDSDYAIWRAFDNEYWPANYFIDAKGHIRHHQFGEGEYLQGEAVIQQLRRTWRGHRRSRQRHRCRTTALPTHPAIRADLRSPVRNRVSRPWCGGVRLYVRLINDPAGP